MRPLGTPHRRTLSITRKSHEKFAFHSSRTRLVWAKSFGKNHHDAGKQRCFRALGGSIADKNSRNSPESVSAGGFTRKHWVGLFLIATLGAAAWFLRKEAASFQWDVFFSTLRGLDWRWMTAALGLILLTYLGRALRWEVMIRPMCPAASIWYIFKATAIGFTAIVLFGRAGELVRPYLIAKKEKLTFSSQMAVWLIERIFDLLMVLLIFGAALTRVSKTAAPNNPGLRWVLDAGGWIAAGAALVALVILIAFRHFTDSAQERLMEALSFLPPRVLERIRKLVASFSAGMGSTRDNAFALRLLAYTFVEWTLVAASFYAVFRAFPATAELGWNDILVFMGFVSFGSAVQIPGIGGGMQIAAVVVLTELFGLGLEVSSGLAVVIWATSFVVIVPFGLGLALHEGIRFGNLREISKETAAEGGV
ncbi:MAG: lysylphosphatidylglycerol synthase transmembrane domain-containing protein [Bryobacteraceae bacterium]